jgi:hypothetical protein
VAKDHKLTSAPNDATVSAGRPSDLSDRLAHAVSAVMNPGYVALPTFLVVAVATAPNVWTGAGWWVVTTLGISVAPLLYVALGVRSGRFSDHHLSVREQRLVPFVVGLVSAGAALAILLAWHASRALLATVASVVIGVVIAMAITHGARWKVSLHLGGIAGSVTVFVLLFGPILLVLTPLVALVGWARWRVSAHSVAQAVVATILAVVITGGTFWLLRVPITV